MTENHFPKHMAIIMDGNRRWSKAKGLPVLEGHRAGAETLEKIAAYTFQRGIKVLTVFAFSTENWSRPKEEVNFLMKFLIKQLPEKARVFHQNNVRLKVLGRKEDLSSRLQTVIREIENLTKNNTAGTLCIALSYGGRQEIVEACRKIAELGARDGQIDERLISDNLWTVDLPDPDIVIRTGGVKRISNFLLWQMAYSELFFTDTLWPDFSEEELDKILKEYNQRERRFGR